MNQHSPENEPTENNQAKNEPNNRFSKVQALLERSVMGCNQIHEFGTKLLSAEEHSAADLQRFKMLPTEIIVAMHNLKQGVETGLLTLAAIGLQAGLQQAKDIFIDKAEGESTDLARLFEHVVENGGPKGFVAVADISIPLDAGIETDEYLGSLDFLKEMAVKYQQYDFENVPKVMEGACNLGKKQPTGFPEAMADTKETCAQLQNSQSSNDSGINSEEVGKYQKMSEELINDANMIFGQFCAVGSVYLSFLPKS